MTALAPTLQAFFTDRLIGQRQASAHTVAAYRDTFRLLLRFAEAHVGKAPSVLDVGDLDAETIGAFLIHLRDDRHNRPRTRNARLSAVHALFRYAALHHPEHAATIQGVLAVPPARFDKADIAFLEPGEVEALLAAPDRSRWFGRRDHALLAVAIQTGLRVSELTGLTCGDVHLGAGAHVRCVGKGRKQRATPLTARMVAVLRAWLDERGAAEGDPLFSTSRGRRLSTDAVALILARHIEAATKSCPTLASKNVTPHVLRHTAAMRLCTRVSTPRPSPSGSATNRSRPPRSTSTPTRRSKNAPSRAPPRSAQHPDATDRRTRSSRSWNSSADTRIMPRKLASPRSPPGTFSEPRHNPGLGITQAMPTSA